MGQLGLGSSWPIFRLCTLLVMGPPMTQARFLSLLQPFDLPEAAVVYGGRLSTDGPFL